MDKAHQQEKADNETLPVIGLNIDLWNIYYDTVTTSQIIEQ